MNLFPSELLELCLKHIDKWRKKFNNDDSFIFCILTCLAFGGLSELSSKKITESLGLTLL